MATYIRNNSEPNSWKYIKNAWSCQALKWFKQNSSSPHERELNMLKVETSYISNLSGKEFQSSRAPRLTHLIQSNQQNNIGLVWYMFSFSFSFPGFFQLFKLNFETCLNFFFFFKFCLAPYFLTRFQFYFYFIFYCYPTIERGREKRVVDIYL